MNINTPEQADGETIRKAIILGIEAIMKYAKRVLFNNPNECDCPDKRHRLVPKGYDDW